MSKKINLLLLFIVISGSAAFSNNLVVSNVSLTGQNTTSDFTLVKFDISWDNSWRTSLGSSNWDAAWIFIKYRLKTQSTWHHATLNYIDGSGSGDGHTVPSNATIASSNDNGAGGAYGVFLYRNGGMTQSSVSYNDVQLRWNYGDDGLGDGDDVEVCVFAIEMVYVPQGSFYLGSGGTEQGSFTAGPYTSGATTPFQVTSESAITIANTSGNLWGTSTSGNSSIGGTGTVTAAFPKGYAAFYCMKYEITQEQYAGFLNKLTTTQDATRYPNQNGNNRHAISGSAGARTSSNPNVACNYLDWADVAAYLDWAALRPMTELEYEKACRGTLTAVANEYAWGSTSITVARGISNSGLTNETASNGDANCVYNNESGVQGPMRAGCLGQGVNTREGVGAGYYGIMELSGNLWERTITIGSNNGRAFTGANGDGVLDATGNANTTNWPSTNASGAGFRGGNWLEIASRTRVSDRIHANTTYYLPLAWYGGRGVRVAP